MRRAIQHYLRDTVATVTVMMILFSVVVVGSIGFMIDIGRAYSEHTRLQHFIDSVSVAAALELDGGDDAIDRAMSVLQNEEIAAAGVFSGKEKFQIQEIVFLSGPPVRRPDGTYDYESVRTTDPRRATHLFANVRPRQVGFSVINVLNLERTFFDLGASAIASVSQTQDNDIEMTFAIDSSPSMLIGATPEAIAELERTQPPNEAERCAFACHYDSRLQVLRQAGIPAASPTEYFAYLRAAGMPLRFDAALNALKEALQIARDAQFNGRATTYFDVTTFWRQLDAVPGAAGRADLILDSAIEAILPAPDPNEPNTNTQYMMTNYPNVMAEIIARMASKFPATEDREHVLVLITDGVANYNVGGAHKTEPINPDQCQRIKDLGAKIAVIYATYFDFPESYPWRVLVKPHKPYIATKLQACASPGLFFEGGYSDDISDALKEILRRQFQVESVMLTD